ncbi:phage portal protein [Dietzia aurantiaca]|uniref:phage portal protein n=1 Tax=Dietzia aurantiaca TaxID=983873 RepID=UPI001E5ED6E6|nr:phage portal protein [Dietzia aurantiaca]MCD2263663.1 phage portal protein [Dietzia aurantiaca]
MARVSRRTVTTGTLSIASPETLTAAAHRINLKASTTQARQTGGDEGWKTEAWQRFDEIGELRAVCQWFAGSLSRVRLVASDINPKTGRPTGATNDHEASTMVADIAGGPAGQAAMLSRLATFLTVPGEGWVAIVTRRPNPEEAEVEEWHILADDEITTQAQDVVIELPDGAKHHLDPDRDSLFRIWNPHPRHTKQSDSPVRAALSILREIRRCEQTIEAASRSRVAGNGILAVPSEISIPSAAAPVAAPATDPDAPELPAPPVPADVPVSATDLMASLQTAMTAAIQDQSSAAAMVPIVLKAPGEHLDKIRHITLSSEVTETAVRTRETSIRRLALSLDVPPEVLLGVADANHWSAWASQDQAINQHIAPMMTTICDALTESVLRPLLESKGHPDPESVVVWFDLTDLAKRPDRGADAQAAYEAGAISREAYLRELGFDAKDAPDPNSDEGKRELAVQMVSRAPSLFPLLADVLGFDIPAGAQMPGQAPGQQPAAQSRQPVPDTIEEARRG